MRCLDGVFQQTVWPQWRSSDQHPRCSAACYVICEFVMEPLRCPPIPDLTGGLAQNQDFPTILAKKNPNLVTNNLD
jgi:hypothetical protein